MTIYDIESVFLKPSISLNAWSWPYSLTFGGAIRTFDINFNNSTGISIDGNSALMGMTYGYYVNFNTAVFMNKFPCNNTVNDGYGFYGIGRSTGTIGLPRWGLRGPYSPLTSNDVFMSDTGNVLAFGNNTFVSIWNHGNNNNIPGYIYTASIDANGVLGNVTYPTSIAMYYYPSFPYTTNINRLDTSNRFGFTGNYFWGTSPALSISSPSGIGWIATSSNGYTWASASMKLTNSSSNLYTKCDDFSNIIYFNNKYYFILGNKMYSSSNIFYNGNASVVWGTGSIITSPSSKVAMQGGYDGVLVTSGASVLFMPLSGSTLNIFRTSDMTNWTDITANLPIPSSSFNIPSYGLIGYTLKYSKSWGAFFLYHDAYSHISTASIPNYFYSIDQGNTWNQVKVSPPSIDSYYTFTITD